MQSRANFAIGLLLCTVAVVSCHPTEYTSSLGRRWHITPVPPTAGRYEGLSFPTPDLGWMVSTPGDILHTKDGGSTWKFQARGLGTLRSVDFQNETRGLAGTVDGTLYRTTDAGASWTDVTSTLPRAPQGFCGIAHVGNHVHAVGRYTGRVADYFRSTDGGETWKYSDLSSLAEALVDVLFLDSEVGLMGGMARSVKEGAGPALILKTVDGGVTWQPVFVHGGGRGFAWKLFAASRDTVYAALQTEDGIFRIARSVDSGSQWQVHTIAESQSTRSSVQAVGFVNDDVGWVAGYFEGMYATTDGGRSWKLEQTGTRNVNRFVKAGSILVTADPHSVLRLVTNPSVHKPEAGRE